MAIMGYGTTIHISYMMGMVIKLCNICENTGARQPEIGREEKKNAKPLTKQQHSER